MDSVEVISGGKHSCLRDGPHNESATGAEERDTLERPRGDCKAYQKCISTIFDNFGEK